MYIYVKTRRNNKWEENLQKKRIVIKLWGRIDGKSAIGILERGCYIWSWSCLTKFC